MKQKSEIEQTPIISGCTFFTPVIVDSPCSHAGNPQGQCKKMYCPELLQDTKNAE